MAVTYGYARVSTSGQARDGNSLEAQTQILKSRGAEKIYCENFTGTKKDRPELDKLLSIVQSGDVVIVTKLDRLARSARAGLEIIDEFLEKGVRLEITNLAVFDGTTTGKLMRTMMLGIAEFERDMIVERTREGKEIAKQKDPNWREGRKEKQVDYGDYPERVRRGEITVKDACKELGISRTLWYKKII